MDSQTLAVTIISGTVAVVVMGYPIVASYFPRRNGKTEQKQDTQHGSLVSTLTDIQGTLAVRGERLARIETTTEALKETAVAVGQALITHDAKDERIIGEVRLEMKEGFKGVNQKIDALTSSVMQALGNKP